jgi:hypothetical protein
MDEVWKDVEEWDYEVSSLGQVRRKGKETCMKLFKDYEGYNKVSLSNCGKKRHYSVHRLMALAFLPNPKNLQEVDHINGVKDDNRLENLRWASRSQNQANTVHHNSTGYRGVKKNVRGGYQAKITYQGKFMGLGTYDTPEEAHNVYKTKAQELFGVFVR